MIQKNWLNLFCAPCSGLMRSWAPWRHDEACGHRVISVRRSVTWARGEQQIVVAPSLQTQRFARWEDSLRAGTKLKGTRSEEREMLIATWGWHSAPTFCWRYQELGLAIGYLNLFEEWNLKHPGDAACFSRCFEGCWGCSSRPSPEPSPCPSAPDFGS